MNKKTLLTIVLLVMLCVVIAVVPLMTLRNTDFAGADGVAKDAISEIDPDYVPWAESVLEAPGTETESLLFAVQAAIGASVLGYGFGYLVARKKYKTEVNKEADYES